MDELMRSTSSETKSTAGDKHETGRAMVHLEQEKAGKQFEQLMLMKRAFDQIDSSTSHDKIQIGSLVRTNLGWYLFSVGLGWLSIDNCKVYCLSGSAPIAKLYFGRKAGESFTWQEQVIEILSVD